MSNVTPSYVFTGASDPLTFSKLNLLGTPTVSIGTSEIVTAMISNNAVTVAKLAQVTNIGFLGRSSNGTGNVSFVTLNDGSISWPSQGMSLGAAANQVFLIIGNGNTKSLKFQYGSTASPQNEIFVGSSTSISDDTANGATRWTGGTFQYYIGDGTSTRTLGLTVALSSGIPIATSPGVFASGATSGLGYSSGAGGTVTQITNRTSAVTLNKVCGAITTANNSLAALASATFTVQNSTVAATDTVVAVIKSGAVNEKTMINVNNVNAGNFSICVYNADTGVAETGAIVINFAVIKAVAS